MHTIKSWRETAPRVHPNAIAPFQSGTRHATPSRHDASKASRCPRPRPSLHGPAKLGKTARLVLAPPRHRGPSRPGKSGQHGPRQHRPGPLRGRARSGPPVPLTPCPHQLLDRSAEFVAVKPPRLIRVQRLPQPLAQPGIECDKGQPSRPARPAGPLVQPARSASERVQRAASTRGGGRAPSASRLTEVKRKPGARRVNKAPGLVLAPPLLAWLLAGG